MSVKISASRQDYWVATANYYSRATTLQDVRVATRSATDQIARVTDTNPIWTPSAADVERANVTRFIHNAVQPLGGAAAKVVDSPSLYEWSIAEPERFWPAVWHFCGVVSDERDGTEPWDDVLIGGERMAPPDPTLGPRWFTCARLKFAENLLRYRDDRDALVAWSEQGFQRRLSFAELARDVLQPALAVGIGEAQVAEGLHVWRKIYWHLLREVGDEHRARDGLQPLAPEVGEADHLARRGLEVPPSGRGRRR